VLGEQRRLADEAGQRRPQLVGHVRSEAPLSRARLRERVDLRLERRRHLVERLRPGAELVLALDREPGLEQPLGERVRRVTRLRDRPQRLAREHGPRERGQQDEQAAADKQDVP
jgi:hypothetical protein